MYFELLASFINNQNIQISFILELKLKFFFYLQFKINKF